MVGNFGLASKIRTRMKFLEVSEDMLQNMRTDNTMPKQAKFFGKITKTMVVAQKLKTEPRVASA